MTLTEAIEKIEKTHCQNNEHCKDNCMYGKNVCEYQIAIESIKSEIKIKKFVEEFTERRM